MIALRPWSAKLAAIGSTFAVLIFLTTFSFLLSLPGWEPSLGVDREGNIFAAGPGGVHVISPEGKHLGSIETGTPTGNVGWGEDGSTLFITAGSNVFRLKLTTKGAGF